VAVGGDHGLARSMQIWAAHRAEAREAGGSFLPGHQGRRRGLDQALRLLRFTPGPGVGGHCLPIAPSYLSWRVRRSLGVSFLPCS
jgi:hypothetical protein